ncbi:MAG TPA: VOC family protein, partial [Pseudoneobacillus sp.]|nr:VOC family protein [Pseudoneobacillus sp.]
DKGLSSREGHFALRVENYHDALNWLKQNNVAVLEKPNSQSGFAQIFCTDPDGNLIELNVDAKDLK